jgi:hypothetical protein
VVTAIFYGFAPSRVAEAVPAVWRRADPDAVVAARQAGAGAALARLLAEGHREGLIRATELARSAAEHVGTVAGRPLTAANLSRLDRAATVEGRLWQAMTVLREHRGEGHVIALAHAEVGPVESHVLRAAAGEAGLDFLRSSRGWSTSEVNAAQGELERRGWLSETGALTAAGRSARVDYEGVTDRLAAGPWRALGSEPTSRLAELLLPIAERVVAGCAEAMRLGLGSPWPPP